MCVCVRACVRVGNTDYQTLHEKELKLVEEKTQRRMVSFGRYMSTPPQEGAVSTSSSVCLLTSLSVLCVTKCPFSVCSDDSLSPHLISRYR